MSCGKVNNMSHSGEARSNGTRNVSGRAKEAGS